MAAHGCASQERFEQSFRTLAPALGMREQRKTRLRYARFLAIGLHVSGAVATILGGSSLPLFTAGVSSSITSGKDDLNKLDRATHLPIRLDRHIPSLQLRLRCSYTGDKTLHTVVLDSVRRRIDPHVCDVRKSTERPRVS